MKKTTYALVSVGLAFAMVLATLTLASAPAKAWVSPSLWDPGYIISDQQFFDANSMTVNEIQAFLNARVPTCQPERSAGPSDPIVCLKDYRQTTTTRAADAYCPNTYVGASNETAATIIYKVAQACNINPKVLLVTLQKENGLVTHTWPSSWRYTTAMGYGCPDDGSGCQSEYYGFQNQIWRAARQFQRYTLLPTSYNYRAGMNNQIGYHPNNSCGTQTVYIRNAATAALYNYTPYVPNAAALNAMPGTGNSCSSYGNRNFWMYYWEWFGSPIEVNAAAVINDLYLSTGGASGPLGARKAIRPCVLGSTACWQDYDGGLIGWTHAGGAWTVLAGDIHDRYIAAGGPGGAWGYPTSFENAIESPTGNGRGQNFQNVQALSSAAGTFAVSSVLLPEYTRLGWLRGALGWPTASEVCSGNNCAQQFQGGMLGRAGSQGFQLSPEVLTKYLAAGGPTGAWGVPTSAESAISSPRGDGSGQNFQSVQVLSSASGVYAVPSSLLTAYGQVGWVRGDFGWPTSNAVCEGSTCAQEFQGGALSHVNGQSFQVSGSVFSALQSAGGIAGPWGVPTSAESSLSSPHGSGRGQNFAGGQALSSAQGTYLVPTRVLATYSAAGWIRGSLGWPTGSAVCNESGACTQQFQGGEIATPAGSGLGYVVDTGPIAVAFQNSGGPSGPWGSPMSDVSTLTSPRGNGLGQNFANGQALSSSSGTFFVPSRVLSTYANAGWIRGALGWPTANAVCEGSGLCTQQFQGGSIAAPAGGGAGHVVENGPISVAFQAAGGASGPWGAPTSSVSSLTAPLGNGQGQNYAHGQALSSAAGTYFVPTRILATYGSAGWIRGALGWPTANAVCDGTGACTQNFQGGTITTPAGNDAGYVLQNGPITVAFQASGGPTGPWGVPTSTVSSLAAPRGNGQGQNFTNGQALASSAGVYLVPNRILPTYSSAGWIRGGLGWPSAPAVCPVGGLCTQQFQGGMVSIPASGGAGTVTLK